MGIRKRVAFQIFSYGLGLAVTGISRVAANRGYRLVKKVDPPANPASRRTHWKTALAWAAMSGAIAAMSGVLGRRAAAGVWHHRVGRLPAGVR